jgi:hypothetical protein
MRTKQKPSLCFATLEDAELLLKWCNNNDMTTRMASHMVDEVKAEKHIEWLKATLQNKNEQLYVAKEKGTFVGTR